MNDAHSTDQAKQVAALPETLKVLASSGKLFPVCKSPNTMKAFAHDLTVGGGLR
jgi:hypothetical protein